MVLIVFFKRKSIENQNNVASKDIEVKEEKLEATSSVLSEPTDDVASDFLISGLSDNLKKLIKKARKRGFVSRAMVEQASELDGLSAEEAEDALIRISEIGVNVREEYDEGDELSLDDDEELDEDEDCYNH